MTEWHTPGEQSGEAPVPEDGATPDESVSSGRPQHSRQKQLLVLAGVIIAAAVALVLVVVLNGPDGPAKGSPEAVTDSFASALRSGSSAQVGELSCVATKTQVLRGADAVLGKITSARRQGAAKVRGDIAVTRIVVSLQSEERTGTLALSHATGRWCVQAFLAAVPAQ